MSARISPPPPLPLTVRCTFIRPARVRTRPKQAFERTSMDVYHRPPTESRIEGVSFEHAFGDSVDRGYRRPDDGSTRAPAVTATAATVAPTPGGHRPPPCKTRGQSQVDNDRAAGPARAHRAFTPPSRSDRPDR